VHFATGGLFALSQLVLFSANALIFWSGAKFISKGWISFEDMLRVFFALAMAASMAGQNSQFVGDQAKANAATASLFGIMDRKKDIDPLSDDGLKPETCRGEIEFRDVSFAYPTRPNQFVLKVRPFVFLLLGNRFHTLIVLILLIGGFQHASFRIAPGQMVAFVGASGCGKSTIVRLLLRYYDVSSGEILLDGVNIKQLNVKWLREQFGLVQQEPDLFPDTLEYNIQYGEPGADLHPSDPNDVATTAKSATEVPASVVEAAAAANAASFIDSFSLKYATKAGELGSQLSGGQKQRIAIARAVIRKPHVLLLDEATSALDSESERIVQQALDNLIATRFGGVTTLVIAHRLSTIRAANVIVVLDEVCVHA
jgi:ATP-binding cassette, subfamily B (MDR/TAP), member 1